MKFLTAFACLLLVTAATAATPVHLTLRAVATAQADADGFFALGAVADLSGGTVAARAKLAAVRVGRAPLSDSIRLLTPGDVALKLRQAGFDPDKDVTLSGAKQVSVTLAAPPAPNAVGARYVGALLAAPSFPTAPSLPTPPLSGAALIRSGDAVTILVQDGDIAISARGIARSAGGAGAMIRVHREGIMTDLTATVLDAQTVRLEMD